LICLVGMLLQIISLEFNLGQILDNYPVACPAGSAITQLDDSVTCTSFLQSSSSGQDLTNLSLSKGLVAFYPFSTGARDLSGQGNDGTVIGATHNGIGV